MVKYKLDCMRKKMETQERNATSRASFKCVQCFKTFTDLEVKIIFSFMYIIYKCYCECWYSVTVGRHWCMLSHATH